MAKPTKEIQIGNIEVRIGNDPRFYKFGLDCTIRDSIGNGWELPLNDITSDDLRDLADLMDEHEEINKTSKVKKHQLKL